MSAANSFWTYSTTVTLRAKANPPPQLTIRTTLPDSNTGERRGPLPPPGSQCCRAYRRDGAARRQCARRQVSILLGSDCGPGSRLQSHAPCRSRRLSVSAHAGKAGSTSIPPVSTWPNMRRRPSSMPSGAQPNAGVEAGRSLEFRDLAVLVRGTAGPAAGDELNQRRCGSGRGRAASASPPSAHWASSGVGHAGTITMQRV